MLVARFVVGAAPTSLRITECAERPIALAACPIAALLNNLGRVLGVTTSKAVGLRYQVRWEAPQRVHAWLPATVCCNFFLEGAMQAGFVSGKGTLNRVDRKSTGSFARLYDLPS